MENPTDALATLETAVEELTTLLEENPRIKWLPTPLQEQLQAAVDAALSK